MPADADPRSAGGTRWLSVVERDGGGQRAEFVRSRADGGTEAIAAVELDADGVVTLLQTMPVVAPKAPQVWFAEFRESTAAPPAVNLVAFTGTVQRPHTLVSQADLSNLPVTSADQLGAVRWYPATGEVDQVYVQPAWRRHSIGTVLVLAASTLSMARGWGRLWGDGQRTEVGETWRNASVWRDRTVDLTHVAPPMTPGE